jgi:hypothetical protein
VVDFDYDSDQAEDGFDDGIDEEEGTWTIG